MANIILPPSWALPERAATDEAVFWNRRAFLRQMGFTGVGALALLNTTLAGCTERAVGDAVLPPAPPAPAVPESVLARFPAKRNPAYASAGRPISAEAFVARYNNFYEFTTEKSKVWRLAQHLVSRPWQIEISGLVEKPGVFDVDDLIRTIPQEERIYRFRCVEAWAMTVPWTGFSFSKLIEKVQPTAKAQYVRMLTFLRPEQAVGQRTQTWYDWPYYEALRLDEAMNELTMLVTGIYGKPLPNQHGAPIRLIVPWKYGFKSIKSIVKIEFTAKRPHTFWNDLAPKEYGFLGTVDPTVPHPRWSQASERLLATQEKVPTLPYNGYGAQVAHLYT